MGAGMEREWQLEWSRGSAGRAPGSGLRARPPCPGSASPSPPPPTRDHRAPTDPGGAKGSTPGCPSGVSPSWLPSPAPPEPPPPPGAGTARAAPRGHRARPARGRWRGGDTRHHRVSPLSPPQALILEPPPPFPLGQEPQWFQLRSERRWGPLFSRQPGSPAHNKSLSYRKGREREGGRGGREGRRLPETPSPPKRSGRGQGAPHHSSPRLALPWEGQPPHPGAEIWGNRPQFLSLMRVSSGSQSLPGCPSPPSVCLTPPCVP